MLTLPPAHTLGVALAQATVGALGSLLTIVAICAPLLLLWWGCRWLERRLPLPMPPDSTVAAADPAALADLEDVATMPTLRAIRSLGRQTLMHPLMLSDVELVNTLAEVETAPALRALPSPPPSSPPPPAPQRSAFPLYQPPVTPPVTPSSQLEPPAQPSQPWQVWDNWPPRGKPGQYPYRYIFVGSELVRVASLSRYIATDFQPFVWN